jgi:hypothetical protein
MVKFIGIAFLVLVTLVVTFILGYDSGFEAGATYVLEVLRDMNEASKGTAI